MENKKRVLITVLVICIFSIMGCYRVDASLGLTPALIETDFEPGLSFLVNFNVLGADSSQKLIVYADGDFAEYVRFDKTNLTGPESFTAYIDLPQTSEKPGKNKLYIKVGEVNKATSGLGARLEIGALILIKVPYPGKYAEIKSFSVNDANEGELVNFNLEVESLGAEDIYVSPNIKVYSNNETIEDINLEGKTISPKTSEVFSKTSDIIYKAGVYNATVTFDYGSVLKKETVFRIGNLFINVTNWSSSFQTGKINKFFVDIESRWNSDIKNVYAEVNVSNYSSQVDFFKTPSIELKRWENARLEGFFSSENLRKGNYTANISVIYEGKKTEKTVNIEIFNSPNPPLNMKLLGIGILIGLVILFLIAIIIFLLFKRNKEIKKTRRKNFK